MNGTLKANHKKYLFSQQGFSLVELMIAMALGLVLVAGVIQVFTSANQTYRLTDRAAQLQEDMRFILGRMQQDVRMAGHYGCLVGNPTNNLNATGSDFPVIFGNRAITGWEAADSSFGETLSLAADDLATTWSNGTSTALPAAIPTPATTIAAGSDFFVVNGADRTAAQLTGISGNQVNTNGESGIGQGAIVLLVSGNCAFGDVLQKTSNTNATNIAKGTMAGFTPGNNTPGFLADGRMYDGTATAYEFHSTLYYVGTNAGGEPGLFRQRLSTAGAVAEELVSGVENMQVLYGVSPATGNRHATQYVTAENVTDWGNVVSLRIAILMRSANAVQDVAEVRTFNLLGTQVTTDSDRRARLMGTVTIAIRNSLQ